jgi:hypothetical protein
MSLFHKTLYDAVSDLIESSPPKGDKEGETEEDTNRKLEEGYKKARKILDEHLQTEFSDEKSVGRLLVLLKLYKEKVEQARSVLDKDFRLTPELYGKGKLSREELKEKVNSIPNMFRDLSSFERLIGEAEICLKEIESILAQLIRDGKIKLK